MSLTPQTQLRCYPKAQITQGADRVSARPARGATPLTGRGLHELLIEQVTRAVPVAVRVAFQEVARAHFVVRRLERRYGKDAIRTAYERFCGETKAAA